MNREERQRRLDRARFAIQAELLTGVMVVIVTGFFILLRGGFDPMGYLLAPFQALLLAAPFISLFAWFWMLRLSRPRPEAGERSWRYHDRTR